MQEKKWWHDKVIYEIYPKSFKDDNNDGIGDIKGIISKLDYLKDLGVDIIWITPFFLSPMVDNGYDVEDYTKVNPIFGTMDDVDLLLDELKKREMYLMIDIVANHTSDKHPWFIESRKSKDNPYRDFYIWRETPPYERTSCFGDSAWTLDPLTNEYYYHEFAKEQPDLNWENPKVMDAFSSFIEFWLKKGVKGIRFDVIHFLGKEIDKDIHGYGPTLHEKVKELKHKSFGKYDIVTVGEAWGELQNAIDFSSYENDELDMVFQFEHTSYTNDRDKHGKWTPRPINMKDIRDILFKYQRALNDVAWNTLFVENHDLGRAINRFGDLNYYRESGTMIPTMIYFLKGTPYLYQGQEIGMINIRMNDISEYEDVEIHGSFKNLVLDNHILTRHQFMEACYQEGRDNNRTPFQWANKRNAGWNRSHKPWLKINENYHYINAEDETKDPSSILNYYKKVFALRKDERYASTFVYGSFKEAYLENENVFSFTREDDKNLLLIVCNMHSYPTNIYLSSQGEVLLHNYEEKEIHEGNNTLLPYESFVIKLR
ncbi:MAG: alpha-glucosidase [Bacilli bacterium]|nr:alpha-glucosidase [Bacilli bacterium]